MSEGGLREVHEQVRRHLPMYVRSELNDLLEQKRKTIDPGLRERLVEAISKLFMVVIGCCITPSHSEDAPYAVNTDVLKDIRSYVEEKLNNASGEEVIEVLDKLGEELAENVAKRFRKVIVGEEVMRWL